MERPEFKPGLYRHYKGGLYRALFLARNSEHREQEVVVYVSISEAHGGKVWVRPFCLPLLEGDDCWCDVVAWPGGQKQQRFMPVKE